MCLCLCRSAVCLYGFLMNLWGRVFQTPLLEQYLRKLSPYLCVHSFVFFFFCLCVPMCVYVCVLRSTLSNLHTPSSEHMSRPPPPSLCFCRWTVHLVFMKDRGIKTKCQPTVDRFHPPRLGSTVTFLWEPRSRWTWTMSETETKASLLHKSVSHIEFKRYQQIQAYRRYFILQSISSN